MNKIVLSGRIASDVELKQTASGKSLCKLSLAVKNPYRRTPEGKPIVNFFDIVAWDQPAEFIARYLAKGAGLLIHGELDVEAWEGQDVRTKTRTVVKAQEAEGMGAAKAVESVPA